MSVLRPNEQLIGNSLKAELAKSSWTIAPWPRISLSLSAPISRQGQHRGRRLLAIAGVAVIAVVAVGAVVPQTRETARAFIQQKFGIDPWAGLSDAQKQAQVDQTHARNAAFLRDFVSRHGDPRTLPVIRVPDDQVAPATLREAVDEAQIVVRGTVTDTSFALNPQGGLPLATASVTTIQVVKGHVPSDFQVRQLGGPVAQGAGGALAELDDDPLLLPGDDVILLLRTGPDGTLRTLPGDGILYVVDDVVRAESGSPIASAVNGLSVADVLPLL
jgi:hypothetical protein